MFLSRASQPTLISHCIITVSFHGRLTPCGDYCTGEICWDEVRWLKPQIHRTKKPVFTCVWLWCVYGSSQVKGWPSIQYVRDTHPYQSIPIRLVCKLSPHARAFVFLPLDTLHELDNGLEIQTSKSHEEAMNCNLFIIVLCVFVYFRRTSWFSSWTLKGETNWVVGCSLGWSSEKRGYLTSSEVSTSGLFWSPSVVLCVRVLYSLAGYSETSDDGTNQLNWGF